MTVPSGNVLRYRSRSRPRSFESCRGTHISAGQWPFLRILATVVPSACDLCRVWTLSTRSNSREIQGLCVALPPPPPLNPVNGSLSFHEFVATSISIERYRWSAPSGACPANPGRGREVRKERIRIDGDHHRGHRQGTP